ncbi:MAG: 50S ribosomal protein L35 [Patescibacteria group bacterium]
MPKLKTEQTVAKRFRVTTTGKVIRRHAGQNHFNARDTGKVSRNKRSDDTMSVAFTKTIKILSNQL